MTARHHNYYIDCQVIQLPSFHSKSQVVGCNFIDDVLSPTLLSSDEFVRLFAFLVALLFTGPESAFLPLSADWADTLPIITDVLAAEELLFFFFLFASYFVRPFAVQPVLFALQDCQRRISDVQMRKNAHFLLFLIARGEVVLSIFAHLRQVQQMAVEGKTAAK